MMTKCDCPDEIKNDTPNQREVRKLRDTDFCDYCTEMLQHDREHQENMADAIHDRLVAEGRR